MRALNGEKYSIQQDIPFPKANYTRWWWATEATQDPTPKQLYQDRGSAGAGAGAPAAGVTVRGQCHASVVATHTRPGRMHIATSGRWPSLYCTDNTFSNLSRRSDPEKESHTVTQPLQEGSAMLLKTETKDFWFSPSSALPSAGHLLGRTPAWCRELSWMNFPFLRLCWMHPSFWKWKTNGTPQKAAIKFIKQDFSAVLYCSVMP